MHSKETENRNKIYSKWKERKFPPFNRNKDKWFRNPETCFSPQYVIFGNMVFELSSKCGSLPSPPQTGCDHSLSPWPLDLKIPQAQLWEMGAGKRKIIMPCIHTIFQKVGKKETVRLGNAPFYIISSTVYIVDLLRRQRNWIIKFSFFNFIFFPLWCNLLGCIWFKPHDVK